MSDVAMLAVMVVAGGILGVFLARIITAHLFRNKYKIEPEEDEETLPVKTQTTGGRVVNGRFVPNKVPVEKKAKHQELEKNRRKEDEEIDRTDHYSDDDNIETYTGTSSRQPNQKQKSNKTIRKQPSLPGMPDYDSADEAPQNPTRESRVAKVASKATISAAKAKAKAAAKATAASKIAKSTRSFLLPSMNVFDVEYEQEATAKEDAARVEAERRRAQKIQEKQAEAAAEKRRKTQELEASNRERHAAARQRQQDEDMHDVLSAGSHRMLSAKNRVHR